MTTPKNKISFPANQISGRAREGDRPFEPRWIGRPDAEGNIYWFKWKNRKPLKVNNWLVMIDKNDGNGEGWMTMDDYYEWRSINFINDCS